jgi:BirA family biotin operon repressor/biotin-[acetyl-CoA-carboxylase] ligase
MTGNRHRLLTYLKENLGQWVSGESISNQLGISRTAIWKHINSLKDDGHLIQSAPKKGYCLARAADLLSPEEISGRLDTRFIGRPSVLVFKETDSTNLQAKILASQGAPEGTVVTAETQTQGRGRRGRSWFSPVGQSIYASIILRPPMAPAQAPQITLMTAVAVVRALRGAGMDARIKWPNDVLIEGKKIAGILTEISTEMDLVDWVVVGLGLNVNTPADQMPPEIQPIATSVQIQKGGPFSRIELLCALLKNFEDCYELLKTDGFGPIMQQWRQMTDIIGQRVHVDVMETRHFGTVAAVDDDGVLILKDDQGRTRRIFSGDVGKIRPNG